MNDSHASHPPSAILEPVALRRLFALPLAGLGIFCAGITYDIGAGAVFTPTLHIVLAAAIGLMLLVRAAVRKRPELLRAHPNWPMAAASLVSSIYAAWMMHTQEWTDQNTTQAALLAALATAAGLLAYSRVLKLLFWFFKHPLPVCIAAVMAASPIIFYSYHTLAWQWTAGVTTELVKALLTLCGITLKSESFTQHDALYFEKQGDFIQSIQSDHFGIRMSWECSGIEGMVFFCFFLSLFILFDWNFFSRVKGISFLYPMLLGLVTIINVVRIAGIFLYGHWLTLHTSGSVDVSQLVEAFHSNAGMFIYAGAFSLILPLVYRWARWQIGAKTACRESDEPATR